MNELLEALKRHGQPTRTGPIAKPVFLPDTPIDVIQAANAQYASAVLETSPQEWTKEMQDAVRLETLRVLQEGF